MMHLLPQRKRRMAHKKLSAHGLWTLVVTISAVLIFAAATLHAQTPPRSTPTPRLTKELQEVFDREDKLPPLIRQQAQAVIDQVKADLRKLRDRLEPELVNQEMSDGINPNSGPSSGGKLDCTEPAKPITRFTTKAALDIWYKAQTDEVSAIRSNLDSRYELWLLGKRQNQHNIIDIQTRYASDPRAPGWMVNPLRSLLKNETDCYLDQYKIGVAALLSLWKSEQDELIGGCRDNIQHCFQQKDPALTGLATLMNDEATRQMDAYHNTIGYLNCLSIEKTLAGDDLGSHRFAAQEAAAHQECMVERERLRDEFATRYRDLRDLLIAEGIEVRNHLTEWRALCIANHYYVGDGPVAISAVYGDALPRSLGAMYPWGATQGIYTAGGISANLTGYGETRINAGACGSFNNDNLDSEQVLRYPDVEIAPYKFAVVFDAPSVIERIVSGAAESEGP
jgi:hypothetical protein